jgi:hypothetical protein
MRRQYGDREACGTCGADIEWLGRDTGWRDRGMDGWCSTSGQAWMDADGVPHEYPCRKHNPRSVFTLPPGARRL